MLDAAQRRVAARLAALGDVLRERGGASEAVQTPEPQGVYLWGPVGRGKTWLLDTFVSTLSPGTARRLHLHALFRELHAGLQRHGFGTAGVRAAVHDILADATVLHIEEFHVHDPGNAALSARLLEALAEARVSVVASSNHAPNDLFTDPEFAHVFRPARVLITRHLEVLALDGGVDYRGVDYRGAGYRGGRTQSAFADGRWIVALAPRGGPATPDASSAGEGVELRVDGRGIRALRAGDGEVCFSFAQLLEASTAASDFLTLCERFDTWWLVDVPDLAHASPGALARFVTLVDVLCDLDVQLSVVAATGREALAALPDPPPGLARTISRLALLAG